MLYIWHFLFPLISLPRGVTKYPGKTRVKTALLLDRQQQSHKVFPQIDLNHFTFSSPSGFTDKTWVSGHSMVFKDEEIEM